MTGTRHRIAVVSDPPVSAGGPEVEAFVARFARAIGQRHDVLATGFSGRGKASVSRRTRESVSDKLRSFAPEAVFYVPSPPRRAATFLRARTLRRLAPRAAHGMIHLAPFESVRRWGFVYRFLAPPFVWVGSYRALLNLSRIAVRGDVLCPLADTRKFQPASAAERREKRHQWGIAADAFVVLHLVPPSRFPSTPIVRALAVEREIVQVVGARKTGGARPPVPPGLRETTADAGDLYGIADCCVWSGELDAGDVETPSAPVEALASGLPVLAGPTGGLRDFLSPGDDLHYWDSVEQLPEALRLLRERLPVRTRAVDEFGWERAAGNLVHKLIA